MVYFVFVHILRCLRDDAVQVDNLDSTKPKVTPEHAEPKEAKTVFMVYVFEGLKFVFHGMTSVIFFSDNFFSG